MRYYPDLKLFRWLRARLGIQKPQALEWGGWELWTNKIKHNQPVAFWLTETLPDIMQSGVEFFITPVENIKCHIRNRWVTQSHALVSDLPRGKWHDLDTRILHCLFTELANFVEIEKAHIQVAMDKQQGKQYQMPWWRRHGWSRWGQWRSAQAGIDYLNWEQNLVCDQDWGYTSSDSRWGQPTEQALAAREILALYQWWTVTRPSRQQPDDASGWTAYCNTHGRDANGKIVWGHRSKKQTQILRRMHRIERQHAREDQDHMIRLIRIREALWT